MPFQRPRQNPFSSSLSNIHHTPVLGREISGLLACGRVAQSKYCWVLQDGHTFLHPWRTSLSPIERAAFSAPADVACCSSCNAVAAMRSFLWPGTLSSRPANNSDVTAWARPPLDDADFLCPSKRRSSSPRSASAPYTITRIEEEFAQGQCLAGWPPSSIRLGCLSASQMHGPKGRC